jgi:hypothetical protein
VELRKGHLFDGWNEGVINFPPTYKYKVNSEKYISDDHKSGRRTPAWYAQLDVCYCITFSVFFSVNNSHFWFIRWQLLRSPFYYEYLKIGLMSINLKILVHVLTVNFLVHLCRCDRILSSDKGMRSLSYNTVDNRLSDHRPVTAVYMVDVEVFSSKKLQRALTFTDAEVDDHLSFEEDSASGIYILGLN